MRRLKIEMDADTKFMTLFAGIGGAMVSFLVLYFLAKVFNFYLADFERLTFILMFAFLPMLTIVVSCISVKGEKYERRNFI
jgi:multisubunit Na+/H+ antiporter MnhE subunit